MFSTRIARLAIGLIAFVGVCMAGSTLLAYEVEIGVETEPDGSGEVVPEQLLLAGDTLTVYAVERDESGDFEQLRSGADWSLQGIEGDVTQDDLADNGDGSATFTAGDSGSAIIQADYGDLTPAPSGRITVIPEGGLTGEDDGDLFAGTWHGSLSGEATDLPWDNLGFSMDIRNLEIGALMLESEDGGRFFRKITGSATAVYQNPVSKYPGVQRAFLNRYETSGLLEGKMDSKGWTLEDGETGWDIEFERDNWQPGGYEEAYADGWVYVDDFEGGVLSMPSTWNLWGIDVESSAGNDKLTLSRSYSDPWGTRSYEIQGTLYKISDEQNLDFPEDVGSGERIATDQHTRKIINVSETAEVTANPGSEAEITQSEDGQTTDIEQFNGMLRHKVNQLDPDQSYEIRTPQAVAGVRGTTLWTKVDAEKQETSVDLQEGEIELSEGHVKRVGASGSSTVVVEAGNVDDLSLSDTAASEIKDDAAVGTCSLYDDSSLRVAGGSIDQVRSLGAGAVEISDGTIGTVRAEDNSTVEIYGGELTEILAIGAGNVNISAENITLDGDLEWGEDGEIIGTGTLSGDWVNTRTSFEINIKQNNQDALVRAIEMHAVTFNLGDFGTRTGGGELQQTVASEDSATAPEVDAEEGWIFDGWDKDFSSVAGDLTINAQYQEDADGDGLPDDWEQTIVDDSSAHQGVEDVDPNADCDGDGWSNLQEYEKESDPTQYVLELQEGWNLVSIARAPNDYSVNAIFGDNMAEPVWCWIDGRYQRAEDVVPTGGHWVLSREAVEIDIGAMTFPESPDTDGDGLCDSVEEDIGTDPQTYIITLESGWNLVSLCRVPADNSPEDIFGDKIISPVWEWKGGEYRQAGELKPLKAYWMYRDGDRTTVEIDGLGS